MSKKKLPKGGVIGSISANSSWNKTDSTTRIVKMGDKGSHFWLRITCIMLILGKFKKGR